mmetsp:Transcript_118306/g.339493  ORF Transcript_118306/g.339493 Transcript_118306/m.339493 type:complete len:267 (+) Transcript_118306:894-1694(+)
MSRTSRRGSTWPKSVFSPASAKGGIKGMSKSRKPCKTFACNTSEAVRARSCSWTSWARLLSRDMSKSPPSLNMDSMLFGKKELERNTCESLLCSSSAPSTASYDSSKLPARPSRNAAATSRPPAVSMLLTTAAAAVVAGPRGPNPDGPTPRPPWNSSTAGRANNKGRAPRGAASRERPVAANCKPAKPRATTHPQTVAAAASTNGRERRVRRSSFCRPRPCIAPGLLHPARPRRSWLQRQRAQGDAMSARPASRGPGRAPTYAGSA